MSRERGVAWYALLRQVRPLVLNSARVVEASLSSQGLTVGMRAVLEVLVESGDSTVPAIAARLQIARQGVQRHVDDLRARGYVGVRANPAHRRSVLVAATGPGAEAMRRIREDELSALSALAPGCTREDIEVAVRVVSALNDEIRQLAAGGRP
ncbi:MarR family winged helix-turn-helix transcriptional regulator [Nocardioides pantholopis]|uniref:MarR family winged helix-turn-helix transcriptional regulator n=1 Tax=Nocardioides pantholopis TaxID=2483798 RepID=UPI000F0874AA|nr:MarR family winged helix-turn-helix transcriptional regulator [Nocardioides pantholopis]